MTVVMAIGAVVGIGVLRRRKALSIHALDPPRRNLEAFGALAWAGVAVLVYIGGILGAQIAAGAFSLLPSDTSLRASAILTVGMYAGSLGALGVVWPMTGPRLIGGGFRLDFADVARGLGALLIALPMVWLVAQGSYWLAQWLASLRGAAPPDLIGHVTLTALRDSPRDLWWWLLVGGVVLGAPAVEEIIWRGGVQSALRRTPGVGQWGGGWGAVAGTALLFTLMHIGDASWHTLPTLFALALAMGAVFERTGRLGAAIVMHAGFNALNIALAML